MAEARVVAIVGAESTGKTTLAEDLAAAVQAGTGLRTAWVSEWLREWCAREGRTPRREEQAAIAEVQHQRIAAAAAGHDLVVCDTTALTTAVYSRLIFGDRSLEARAVELHRRVDLSLLTALDLPWVADGHQRDGEHVRAPVDSALRELLAAHALPWALVTGEGAQRLRNALDALQPLLRRAP
jgi:nicotinamide riboside kinase